MRARRGKSLLEIATQLGLASSLALCLDAGAPASYPGSGQTWADLSGNGRDFVRGADGSASTDDPAIVEGPWFSRYRYFNFDGGDFFTKSAANGTFENGLHKDNALWSLVGLIYIPTLTTANTIISSLAAGSSGIGIQVQFQAAGTLRFNLGNGSASATIHTSTAAANQGAWNFIGLAIDEAGGAAASRSYVNGTSLNFNGAYTSPSASNANAKLRIGARGADGLVPLENGSRAMELAMFDTALTQGSFDALYAACRTRVGI